MGGHVGGQVASQLAVATIAEVIRGNNPAPGGDEPDRLVTAIRCANAAVFAKARAEPTLHNMGTTVVGDPRQDDDLLHLCHVGDSRIYRLRQGKLEQVTRDHSLINLYEDNPELAARFGPPNSNVIVRAVGLRDAVEVDHRVIAMEPGDMYLLCCDGLTDMVDDWMLKEMLSDGAERLARRVLRRAGPRRPVQRRRRQHHRHPPPHQRVARARTPASAPGGGEQLVERLGETGGARAQAGQPIVQARRRARQRRGLGVGLLGAGKVAGRGEHVAERAQEPTPLERRAAGAPGRCAATARRAADRSARAGARGRCAPRRSRATARARRRARAPRRRARRA